MAQDSVRSYEVQARSTDIFGRVLCSVRNHHFVVDGPVQNGCPGEEVTPAEMFLAAIAACGVELVQSFAKTQQIALRAVQLAISGALDRDNPVRSEPRRPTPFCCEGSRTHRMVVRLRKKQPVCPTSC